MRNFIIFVAAWSRRLEFSNEIISAAIVPSRAKEEKTTTDRKSAQRSETRYEKANENYLNVLLWPQVKGSVGVIRNEMWTFISKNVIAETMLEWEQVLTILTYSTLKRMTSSIVACLPAPTHVWKKDGATDTPKASELIPLLGTTLVDDEDRETARKVPKSNTNSCCVHLGNSPMILLKDFGKQFNSVSDAL